MKEGRPVFFKTLIVLGIVFVLTIFFILYNASSANISGKSIMEVGSNFSDTISKISKSSLIFIVVEWFVFLILLVVVFTRDKMITRREVNDLNLQPRFSKYKTDIDVLYEILKERKVIRIRIVAEAFGTTQEKAMEWAKILEEGDLANIEYPGFAGEAELKFIEPKVNSKEEKKDGLNKG